MLTRTIVALAVLLFSGLAACVSAWTTTTTTSSSLSITTRQGFFQKIATATAAGSVFFLNTPAPAFAGDKVTLDNGVSYEVVKSGNGPKPEIGELVAIRFAAYNGDIKIDDIFDTAEPYYTRLGSGGLLKGVEQTLPLMRVGDRWVMSIPVS